MRPSSLASTDELKAVGELLELWGPVYPYLARFLLDLWGGVRGDFLEIGPFSGGVARELAQGEGMRGAVLAPPQLVPILEPYLEGVRDSCLLLPWEGEGLPFLDGAFDLVFCRGAFFFLGEDLLREVWRVLAPGGMALLGGGYGPLTPEGIIRRIGERSRELNRALGKRTMGVGELREVLARAGVPRFEVLEEGGLWVLISKGGEEKGVPLEDALGLGEREVVTLVGGGGKTTLMFRLASELARKGKRVITTTTTKIYPPTPRQSPKVILEEDPEELLREVEVALEASSPVTVAKGISGGKLVGVDPETVDALSSAADYVICEGDGSKGRPIKVHGEREPVVPPSTTLFCPVLGADGLGKPLDPQWVFRMEGARDALGAEVGHPIGPREILRLFDSPKGLLKGRPEGARVVVFVNKVEGPRELGLGREVLGLLRERGIRVVLGRAFYNRSVVEVS